MKMTPRSQTRAMRVSKAQQQTFPKASSLLGGRVKCFAHHFRAIAFVSKTVSALTGPHASHQSRARTIPLERAIHLTTMPNVVDRHLFRLSINIG
jgi:hypothetical protein